MIGNPKMFALAEAFGFALISVVLAVSDAVWSSVITAIAGVIIVYLQLRAARETRSDIAKQNVVLATIADVAEKTHNLANSAQWAILEVPLRMSAEAARAKAVITKTPVDVAAAIVAERLLAEHYQKKVDIDAEARMDKTQFDAGVASVEEKKP